MVDHQDVQKLLTNFSDLPDPLDKRDLRKVYPAYIIYATSIWNHLHKQHQQHQLRLAYLIGDVPSHIWLERLDTPITSKSKSCDEGEATVL